MNQLFIQLKANIKYMSKNHDQNQVEIWLAEYQACQETRNHYDSVRWIIGSIFIGASLTLFGISFGTSFIEVVVSAIFSILLVIIWYLYAHHVNPYIMVSIIRCHAIEEELRQKTYNVEQHKQIRKIDDDKEIVNTKGTSITYVLFALIMGMWFLRIAVSMYNEVFNSITCDFVFWILVLVLIFLAGITSFSLIHANFNRKHWGTEISNKIKKVQDRDNENKVN